MNLSKKSWHYRYVKWCTPEKDLVNKELPNTNLCEYFWRLCFLLLFTVIFGPFFLAIIVVFAPLIWLMDKLESKEKVTSAPPKEPKTLVGKWLKAKKEKVCPLIEWTE